MAEPNEIHALHRYFLQANSMRVLYDDLLGKQGPALVDDDDWTQQYLYLCLWYGCLFVVAEGYQKLKLSDPVVDDLLASPNTDLLRRFRNGVFHYQEDYWDDRFVAFMKEGAASAAWARELNLHLGRFFLEWFDARKEGQ